MVIFEGVSFERSVELDECFVIMFYINRSVGRSVSRSISALVGPSVSRAVENFFKQLSKPH